MSKSFSAPSTIRRIAAQRVFQSGRGKPVVLAIGVPQPVQPQIGPAQYRSQG
jgi:hypothetical protein